jgi:hypothetical protein
MASGTADLQRDLGGALLTSVFGALLAAGYSSAMGAAIAASPNADKVTDSTQSQLQLSYASAADLAAENPQYADAITAAARTSFLQGDDWAYTAGVIAVLAGAVLVFFLFPRTEEERRLLADYHAQDTAGAPDPSSSGR